MAIIGFLFCFVVLCYFTFALVFSVVGIIALTGEVSKYRTANIHSNSSNCIRIWMVWSI